MSPADMPVSSAAPPSNPLIGGGYLHGWPGVSGELFFDLGDSIHHGKREDRCSVYGGCGKRRWGHRFSGSVRAGSALGDQGGSTEVTSHGTRCPLPPGLCWRAPQCTGSWSKGSTSAAWRQWAHLPLPWCVHPASLLGQRACAVLTSMAPNGPWRWARGHTWMARLVVAPVAQIGSMPRLPF